LFATVKILYLEPAFYSPKQHIFGENKKAVIDDLVYIG